MFARFRSQYRGVVFVGSHKRALIAALATLAALAPVTVFAQLHTIQPGETLSGIAAFYGVDLDRIASHNGIANPDLIYAGDTLEIPDDSADTVSTTTPTTQTHTVVEGDTVAKIAGQFGVGVIDLATANALADPNLIFPGQVLIIPNGITVNPQAEQMPPAEVRAILSEVEQEFGLPAGLLQALAWQESGWQQHLVSHAGAVGVTQVLPVTALWALESLVDSAPDWEVSVRDNARVGASVLSHYLTLTGGDASQSLAAYYQGWQSIQDSGPFPETELYVNNVLTLWQQFQ